MSSDGSVTSTASRIRQFGLYRTIDARTDEFLRSSRRRQIRQGCACAAISTAITVTVVVSVILVYEYSINSASNVNKKITVKPNWLGLMNDSDPTQTDLKFENKINFDRATLKLLPILIKALNKNRYLEKIIEDYSTSSPYEGMNETENYFQRDIFTNTKNWLKIPTSKVYTIDYRSSPLIYTRPPPATPDYLSRIRKIRNYKMMLDYFNKMISEKVNLSKPTQTLKSEFGYTENPLKMTTARKKINNNQKNTVPKTVRNKSNKILLKNLSTKTEPIVKNMLPCSKNENQKLKTNQGQCKCPKDMGLLLTKLIQSLKEIIPMMASKNQAKSLCTSLEKSDTHGKKAVPKPMTPEIITKLMTFKSTTSSAIKLEENAKTITDPTSIKITTTPQTQITMEQHTIKKGLEGLPPTSAMNPNITQEIITQSSSVSSTTTAVTERLIYTTTSTTANKSPNKTETNQYNRLQSPLSTLENIPMYGNYDIIDTNSEISTYRKLQDKPVAHLVDGETQKATTELIVPLKLTSIEASGSSENLPDSIAVMPNYKHPIIPLFRDKEYDDYLFTTRKTTNDFEDLDVHSFELVRTKNVISAATKADQNRFKNNIKKTPISPKTYHPVVKNRDADHINMRKMADLIYLPKTTSLGRNVPNLSPVYEDEGYSNSSFTTRHDQGTGLLRNIVKIPKSETLSGTHTETLPETNVKSLMGLEGYQGNIENTNEDEFQEEWTKNVEVREKTENNIKYNKPIDDDETTTVLPSNRESKLHDKINSKSLKSMLPVIRPIYLEIRRNGDWKPEDHDDYDINLANNIFEIPDI